MKILGVDPGLVGGCAIINDRALIDAIDIPTHGEKAKRRVNAAALYAWVEQHKPDAAFIERGQAFAKQGVSSAYNYGRAVGAIEAIITCCDIPLTIVEPTMWKKFHRLPGKDKEASRQRVLQTFPKAHALFARKLDHGRAEAVLVALYGASLQS